MLKRRLFKLGVFVLLGAIVNVAVAWGRVAVKGSVYYSTRYFHDPSWDDGFQVVAIHQSRGYNVVWGVDRPGTLLSESPHHVRMFEGRVWWNDDAVLRNTNNYAIACGWPEFSMTSWRTVQDNNEMLCPGAIHCGIVLPALTNPLMSGNVETVPPILALKPLWPGFAINTIFYAAILWLLWIAPGRIRRLVRVNRGRCPACAYFIAPGTCAKGLCSECGAMLPRSLVSGR